MATVEIKSLVEPGAFAAAAVAVEPPLSALGRRPPSVPIPAEARGGPRPEGQTSRRRYGGRWRSWGRACTQKVAEWLQSGGPGKIRSIGKLRSMVREMLAEELVEIDGLVRAQPFIS